MHTPVLAGCLPICSIPLSSMGCGVVAGGGLGVVWFVWVGGLRGGGDVWMELVGREGGVL